MSSPLRFWIVSLGGVTLTIAGVHWWRTAEERPAKSSAPVAVERAAAAGRAPAPGRATPEPSSVESPLQNPPPEGDDSELVDGGSGPSVFEAAERIQSARPCVVLLLSAPCGACREALREFVAELEESGSGIEVLAYADAAADPFEVDALLQEQNARFSAEVLQQWRPGELTEAMDKVGIVVGSQFPLPMFAVVGKDGEIIAQWQGGFDRSLMRKALLLAAG